MNRNCYLTVYGLKKKGIPDELCQKIIKYVVEIECGECILISNNLLKQKKGLFSQLIEIYNESFGRKISPDHRMFTEIEYFKQMIDNNVKMVKETFPTLMLSRNHIYRAIIQAYLYHYEINYKYLQEDAVLSYEMGYEDKCYLNR